MMVLLGFLFTTFLGLSITLLITERLSFGERISMSFGLGLGIQTLLMFYMMLLRIPLTENNVLVFLVFPISILIFLTHKKVYLFFKTAVFSLDKLKELVRSVTVLEWLLILLIILAIIYANLMGFYWPVGVDWDAVALYDWRAKIFADTGFMDEAIRRGYFFGYPLLTSLANAWVYLLGGLYPKFIYSLFYTSFAIMFYSLLRRFSTRKTSLLMTALAITTPAIFGHSALAYTNLPYTFYFTIGTLLVYIWMIEQKIGFLILGSLLIGLSSWVRSEEPFWLAILICIVFRAISRRNFLPPMIFVILFLPIQQSWRFFLSHMLPSGFNVTQEVSYGLNAVWNNFSLMDLILVIKFFWTNVLLDWKTFLIFLIFALISHKKKTKEHFYLWLIILSNIAVLFLGLLFFSYVYPGWQAIPDSMVRMTMFFPPLFLFSVGVLIDADELIMIFKEIFKTYLSRKYANRY